jgi:hypothetical protein
VLIQALSTLKLKSASVMIWLTIFLCSKIVGGDAVLAWRARWNWSQTTGRLMLLWPSIKRRNCVSLSDWLSSCWSSYSNQMEVDVMVGMDMPYFCWFFFRLVWEVHSEGECCAAMEA